ncbi:hypothetical protein DRE_03332 [Drechslerella stenobrocha 248]|uniref:SET domain-containing protein n=1 Tax=Drechslerella stenobrocha 248 TaxID=1043628 RepID=W7I4W6_9PEZI|nr:hypothetical protein DRE_03332 [Drechslerella stenobrocha 248]
MNEVLTNGSRPSPTPSNPSSTRNPLSPLDLPNATTNSEIRCFCGYDQDDGFTIQCDKCSHWQHGICVKINPKNIPETFICYYCEIRDLHQADVKKAKDIQSKRIEGEGRKASAHPKRSSGASHRKRETNGSSHARSASESLSHKPPSPKEQVSGKPRARHRPIPPQPHASLPDTSASPDEHSPTGKSPSIERDFASDLEVLPSVYTKEYSPVSINTIVSPEVDHIIKTYTSDALNRSKSTIATAESSLPCILRRYSASEFHDLVPLGHSVRWVSSPEELSALGLPLIRLVADAPSKADQFVIEYVGEIGSKKNYVHDILNKYQRIRHPKAFVLFHPQLPIYIDARICGSEARFVRRSCRPNLKFETIAIDGTDLRFALFTNQPIERGAELTIGWEWDDPLPFSKLLKENASLGDLEPEQLQKMANWAEVITTNVGECACADQESCVMARLKGDNTVGKSEKSSKAGTKRRWREMQDSNCTGRDNLEKCESESKYKRRSSSTSSHRKSESRDRTPTFPSAEITQSSVITDQNSSAREARKMKETINLIEKLTNPEASRGNKRIKRPSVGPHPPVQSSLPSGTLDSVDKSPKVPTDQAALQTLITSEATPVLLDAVHLIPNGKLQVNGTLSQQTRNKTSYVDDGVQTETDMPIRFPPSSLPTSRKMRILARFRAQSQQREKALKKQLSIVKEEESPIKGFTADKDITMVDAEPCSGVDSPAKASVIHTDLLGPMPTNGVQTSQDHMIQTDITILRECESNGNTVNGNHEPVMDSACTPPRNGNLTAQTPLAQMLSDTPATPALQGTFKPLSPVLSALASSSLSPTQPTTPNVGLTVSMAHQVVPTPPIVPKKMSLSEYSRKRAESQKKDRSSPVATTSMTPVTDTEVEAKALAAVDSAGTMDLDPPNPISHVPLNGYRVS